MCEVRYKKLHFYKLQENVDKNKQKPAYNVYSACKSKQQRVREPKGRQVGHRQNVGDPQLNCELIMALAKLVFSTRLINLSKLSAHVA